MIQESPRARMPFSPSYKRYVLLALTSVYLLNIVDRGLGHAVVAADQGRPRIDGYPARISHGPRFRAVLCHARDTHGAVGGSRQPGHRHLGRNRAMGSHRHGVPLGDELYPAGRCAHSGRSRRVRLYAADVLTRGRLLSRRRGTQSCNGYLRVRQHALGAGEFRGRWLAE